MRAASVALTIAICLGASWARAESKARFPDVAEAETANVDANPTLATDRLELPATGLQATCPRAGILVWRARQRTEQGDVLQALTTYSRAIQLEPSCATALIELARLRGGLGDIAEAERLYARALRHRGHQALAYRERAEMRYRRGQQAAAMADLQAAVSLEPDNLNAIQRLAAWYIQARAWSAALCQYRSVVRLLARAGTSDALEQAEVQVRALSLMAAETDPVLGGGDSDSWIRRSMSRLAR